MYLNWHKKGSRNSLNDDCFQWLYITFSFLKYLWLNPIGRFRLNFHVFMATEHIFETSNLPSPYNRSHYHVANPAQQNKASNYHSQNSTFPPNIPNAPFKTRIHSARIPSKKSNWPATKTKPQEEIVTKNWFNYSFGPCDCLYFKFFPYFN